MLPNARHGRWWGESWTAVVVLTPGDVPPVSFLLNIVMFVPLGMIVPIIWRRTGWLRMFWIGLATSTAIETTQLVLWLTMGSRRMVDINDLISNTAGALLGLLLLRLIRRAQEPDDAQARM